MNVHRADVGALAGGRDREIAANAALFVRVNGVGGDGVRARSEADRTGRVALAGDGRDAEDGALTTDVLAIAHDALIAERRLPVGARIAVASVARRIVATVGIEAARRRVGAWRGWRRRPRVCERHGQRGAAEAEETPRERGDHRRSESPMD
jgi:hypothetical protein